MGLAFYKPIFEKLEGTVLPSHSSAGLAGICTGITQAVTLVTPLEMIKVRQQTEIVQNQKQRKYHGLINTASIIVRQEGGLLATVARQSWGLLVKFTAYIELKAMFQKASSDPNASLQSWQHMFSGGMANVLVGVLNSPPDVVKTRLQDSGSSYKNTWDCVKSMAKQEGITSFFRGSWLRIIRIAPGSFINISQLYYSHNKHYRRGHSICNVRAIVDLIKQCEQSIKTKINATRSSYNPHQNFSGSSCLFML
ncbi:mitochondrial carrier [Rhizopus microsporus]|uniref:Mitochondrial carrier n=1 Tax=Rhizopus microsporus TaxID=58291 RepID=A0A1X0S9Q2_RHIZD|nr:mitochondrial carrier [Rhizopus microsporus]